METKNDNQQKSISPLNFSNTQDDFNPQNNENISRKEDNSLNESANKKKVLKKDSKSKHFLIKFKPEWINKTHSNYKTWILEVKGDQYKFFCKACMKNYSCDYFKLHEANETHLRNVEKYGKEIADEASNLYFFEQLFNNKMKITTFIIQNNLPLSLAPRLATLMQNCFPDSMLAKNLTLNEKNTKEIIFAIQEYIRSEIYDIIKEKPFSLLVDESTDASNKKQLAFIVRYLSNEYQYEYALIDMIHVEQTDSKTLYSNFKQVFRNDDALIKTLVGISTDGARNMRGIYSSLSQKILASNKNIYSIHCLCHVTNLIAKRAHTALPSDIMFFVKSIYSYFSRSALHNDEYINLQKNLNVSPLTIPEPNPTRWTGIYDSISVILERWTILEQYFEKIESGNGFNPTNTESEDIFNLFDEENEAIRLQPTSQISSEQKIYEFLIDKELKSYCQFLKCILQRIISFLKIFEGDNFDCAQSHALIVSFIRYFFSYFIITPK